MYGDHIKYNILVALIIMLLLLMMQIEKTLVYFIRQKYDVFSTFKRWKALVENETEKVEMSQYDNGGEYHSKDFDSYCSYHGIHREKIAPRTPQENGLSERMNMMIMEYARMSRIIKLHVGFPL